MTKSDAFTKAAQRARKAKDWRYVVYEDGDYDVATEFDLDTFWNGANVVFSFGPDGQPEYDS